LRFTDFIPPIFTNLLNVKRDGSGWFHVVSSGYDPWRDGKYIDNFCDVPELNAVINMKANAMSNGRFKVVDDDREYPDEPILKQLKNPNWFQTQKEFLKQSKIFHEVFGNEYLHLNFPVGFGPDRVNAIYTLPSNLIDSEYTDSRPFFVFAADEKPSVKYVLKSDGQETLLDTEQIIHLNDNRARIKSATDKKMLKGDSKQLALRPAINNIRKAYESRGVILESRGANGALSPEVQKDGMGQNIPLSDPDLQKIHDKFKDNYGTLKGQRQLVISPYSLRWTQMGTSKPKDLGLYEETIEDFNKILDAYGTPSELFVRTTGATYENQNQARKGFYTETIIPEAAEWTAALSGKIYPDGKKRIILDYMHLAIFQEDLKSRGDAMTALVSALSKALADGAITIEDYKNELKKFGIGNKN
jgi:hypothetical protein